MDNDDDVSGVFRMLEAADLVQLNQEQVDELIAKYRKELEGLKNDDQKDES